MKLQTHLENKDLGARQIEVATLATRGLSNAEISRHLFITEKSVVFNLKLIYEKLKVKSRAQMIVQCLVFEDFYLQLISS